ncbi:hypothetical protein KC19_8G085600 [Ceratodon purpureus]|uniref:Protein kinase domain-containing protein n=1 Tax=Ceratodon purpureus TaxID=3225 RepID=A0A8T0GYJ9_CERPU|nr:hypothetical protein KC19_8G085600 [Ceratodon purpureus]
MDDDLQNVMRNERESAWQSLSPHPGSDDTSHVIDLHRFVEDAAPELRHPVASTLVSTFSMSEALHVMLQIAEGIVFLHENGVAHGDLKPKNILVAPSEQGGRSLGLFHVKMADFGLVETKMKSKALASRRAWKLEIARWRAPELFDKSYLLRPEDSSFSDSGWDSDSGDHDGGAHTYGKLSWADVYSFAVTCAQILTGDLDPYSGLILRELNRL